MPQEILLAASEILIQITGFTFSYSQAPPNMKTFTLALWFSARGLGKVLYRGFQHLSYLSTTTEIFLYAGFMIVATIIFIVLTWWYHQAQLRAQTEEILKTS